MLNNGATDLNSHRHFFLDKPPCPLDEIEQEIAELEGEITGLLKGLVG